MTGEDCAARSFMICLPNQILLERSTEEERLAGHVARMEGGQVHTAFSWGNLREKDHLQDLRINGWIILKWIFKK